MEFFTETRHAVGRTALLLSGGAILGLYHIGVLKVLWESNLLPRIICGSSSGSIMAGIFCCQTNEEIAFILNPENINFSSFEERSPKYSILRKIYRLFKAGYLMDIKIMQGFLRDNIGDMTFQEAYDKTGRILNITVTGSNKHEQDRLLNYLTSPNVIIWSAVCASCALPLVYGSVDLMCKDSEGNIVKYFEGYLLIKKFIYLFRFKILGRFNWCRFTPFETS
jgi:predicted acylesterase/phospholipase RssA